MHKDPAFSRSPVLAGGLRSGGIAARPDGFEKEAQDRAGPQTRKAAGPLPMAQEKLCFLLEKETTPHTSQGEGS